MTQQPISSPCPFVPERAAAQAPGGRVERGLGDGLRARVSAWRRLHRTTVDRLHPRLLDRLHTAYPGDADLRRVGAELQFRAQQD